MWKRGYLWSGSLPGFSLRDALLPIDFYNKFWKRKLLNRALAKESALVARDSLDLVEAFQQMEDELGE